MTTYLVTWTVYACVGHVAFLGVRVPLASASDNLKPLLAVAGVCQPSYRHEVYDPGRLPEAAARVRQLGRGAGIARCRALECKPREVIWQSYPTFKLD